MQEITDQALMYLRGIWRYRWYAIALAWLVSMSGWIYAYKMPDQYEASARVYVDTDSILRPLLRGLTVQSNINQRVRLLTQTLLSRPNLEKVVRMTDQDIKAKNPEQMEALLNQLSNKIVLKSARGENNLYTISYEHNNPDIAKRTVQSILTIFVEGSLGDARRDTDVAQKFLDKQIREYEAKLEAAENRLTEFKRKNIGLLPGQGGDFFSKLQSERDGLEQAKMELSEARQRREELQRQLEDAKDAQESSLFSSVETPLTSSLDSRIHNLKTQLDSLLLKYTDQHPDVREIKSTIAALEKQKRQELEAMSSDDIGNLSDTDSLYQRLKLALSQAEANVSAAEFKVKEYQQRVSRVQQLMDKQPEVETELKRLNRDYNINKKNYDALVSRRELAQMSEDAERTGDNVKFKVVDPPRVPLKPSGPNRPLISSIVLLIALGSGLALAFIMSQTKPLFFEGKTLRQVTGFPLFGVVSRVWTAKAAKKRRLELAALFSSVVALVVIYAGVLGVFGMNIGHPTEVFQVMKGWI